MNFDEALFDAWAGLTPPTPSAITQHHCEECDEIRDFLSGNAWTELVDVVALRDHYDALHLVTPPAYHYYLPAFMRAAYSAPDRAGSIPNTIVSTIELEFGSASRGVLALFSAKQRSVLAHFLRALPTLNLLPQEDVATLAELLEA